MKLQSRPTPITVTLIERVQLNAREVAFLRVMARHCIETRMAGNVACKDLIALIDGLRVPECVGPVYGLFEEDT